MLVAQGADAPAAVKFLKPLAMKNKLFYISLIIFAMYGCEKIRSYPAEPEITYKSHTLSISKDALGNNIYQLEFSFDFVDGDGDLTFPDSPLRSNDKADTTTYSTFSYKIYAKKDGVYTPYVASGSTSAVINHFLPWEYYMSRDGQNKTFKGSMIKRIEFYQPYPFDTFKVEYYITDFSYHKSNIVEIPEELVLK